MLRARGTRVAASSGRGRVGGPRVYVDGAANVAVVETKGVVVAVRGMLATDRARTRVMSGE